MLMIRAVNVLFVTLLLATAIGCQQASAEQAPSGKGGPAPKAASTQATSTDRGEPWIPKPVSEWPQLVLTNQAKFQGHTPLVGASSFLIKNEKGQVFAATARHLIREAGDVDPPLTAGELDKALLQWVVYPRTKPAEAIELGRVAVPDLDAKGRDWIVMTLKNPAAKLPSYALTLRKDPVRVGEAVYMIGCPYSEPRSVQNVYKGKVTERFVGDYWRFDIEPFVELSGFSGAPILDTQGRVVGVVTIAYDDPKMDGKKWREAGGEDVGSVFEAVQAAK